jgi:hypothetical protein
MKRQNLDAIGKGLEEPMNRRETYDPDHLAKVAVKKKKERTPLQQSSDAFLALLNDIAASAKSFDMVYDKAGNKAVWGILSDEESVSSKFDPMAYPEDVVLKKDIDFSSIKDFANIYFEHFMPNIQGHAKLIDKFHSKTKSTYFHTVKNEKIVFHDAESPDPDWKVKQAYLLLVAAETKAETGVHNLWKSGSTGS